MIFLTSIILAVIITIALPHIMGPLIILCLLYFLFASLMGKLLKHSAKPHRHD